MQYMDSFLSTILMHPQTSLLNHPQKYLNLTVIAKFPYVLRKEFSVMLVGNFSINIQK